MAPSSKLARGDHFRGSLVRGQDTPIREPTVAIRTLVVDGVTWTAWDVVPKTAPTVNPALLREELQGGWLCFEGGAEKRRILPSPVGWETWSDERLTLALKVAEPVKSSETERSPRPNFPA